MSKAIEASLKTATGEGVKDTYEPLNPEQAVREADTPVGLRNNGNTCYFNSLLQTYFTLPGFVEQIMQFVPEALEGEETERTKKGRLSQKLVQELQKVFSQMASSNKKYADPQNVLQYIVDDSFKKAFEGE